MLSRISVYHRVSNFYVSVITEVREIVILSRNGKRPSDFIIHYVS